jgi:NADH-quinone oxidoreductase subunit B
MAVTTPGKQDPGEQDPGKQDPGKQRPALKEPGHKDPGAILTRDSGSERALVPTETSAPIIIPDQATGDALLREFGMEEHPKGGFHGLLEVIPTRADWLLDLIRANSLWPLLSGLSCCAIEMMSSATSMNDIDRFGMFPFRASPRQADVLIVAGTLTTKMAGPLVRLWEQMPEPKWCVAMGTCTTSGGRFKRSYSVVQGVDRVMPVDVYVPGCPPRPEGLIYGLLKLQELVKQRRGQWTTYVDRGPQRLAWEGDVR